jgi:MFS family permease
MPNPSGNDRLVFWGCFIALVTTAFGFITRMFLVNEWGAEFNLDPGEQGRLQGMGVWPFAVSIIAFSFFIDRIGYKTAMVCAFIGHISWAIMGYAAFVISDGGKGDIDTAYSLLYWGSLIMALGNGTVEAFINPVVATMFTTQKTKWLNILHAGWPGGLVIAGIIVIFMGDMEWGYKIVTIAVPSVIYLLMLLPCTFPVTERVTSGVSYREMLAEFGILGALVVGFLLSLQLIDFFSVENEETGIRELGSGLKAMFIGIGAAVVVAFGIYTRAIGRVFMFVMVLIMIPLATTEIGTDGWITGIMEGVFEMSPEEVADAGDTSDLVSIQGKFYHLHPGWVLVYTSAIMMVLRFFAGPIVHAVSPLGLLVISSILAIVGLYTLSFTSGFMLFVAATLYGVGKTFFWPTSLGVVAEQTPKGGALTLNAIAGIGMLAVGVLGFPYIGTLQAEKQIDAVAEVEGTKDVPGLVDNGQLQATAPKKIYEIIDYKVVDEQKVNSLIDNSNLAAPEQAQLKEDIAKAQKSSNQKALANMAVFPAIMLGAYILLIAYFAMKGGYKPVYLTQKKDK